MKYRLLLICCFLAGLSAVTSLCAAEIDSWKVVVSDASVYHGPDERSGTMCSPYRYGDVLDGVRVENDDWISIPFSDRRGYLRRGCAVPLTGEEYAAHAARRAERAAEEQAPDWGEETEPVKKVYPFFDGIGAGRNAVWFIAVLLVVLLVRVWRGMHLPQEALRAYWCRTGYGMILLAAVEWWYFCSLGFNESLWFLLERQTAHDEWLLLGFGAAAVLQGAAALFYLSKVTGLDSWSAGFSRRRLVLGLLLAVVLYGAAALTDTYVISKPCTCLLALAVGLTPHVWKIARRTSGRVAAVYGIAAIGAAALLTASLVYIVVAVICGVLLLLLLVAFLKDADHTLTHMEEIGHGALRQELRNAEKAYGEGRIEASKLEEIRRRVESQLGSKK